LLGEIPAIQSRSRIANKRERSRLKLAGSRCKDVGSLADKGCKRPQIPIERVL
jgi:hypothetical protein